MEWNQIHTGMEKQIHIWIDIAILYVHHLFLNIIIVCNQL